MRDVCWRGLLVLAPHKEFQRVPEGVAMNRMSVLVLSVVLTLLGCSDNGAGISTYNDLPLISVENARALIVGRWNLKSGAYLTLRPVQSGAEIQLLFHGDGTVVEICGGVATAKGPFLISVTGTVGGRQELGIDLMGDRHSAFRICESMFGWDDTPWDGARAEFQRAF
jgi:hypothetical protein